MNAMICCEESKLRSFTSAHFVSIYNISAYSMHSPIDRILDHSVTLPANAKQEKDDHCLYTRIFQQFRCYKTEVRFIFGATDPDGTALRSLIYTWEVLGSNFGRDMGYPGTRFPWLLQSLKKDDGIQPVQVTTASFQILPKSPFINIIDKTVLFEQYSSLQDSRILLFN
jgi:hypothetical protein